MKKPKIEEWKMLDESKFIQGNIEYTYHSGRFRSEGLVMLVSQERNVAPGTVRRINGSLFFASDSTKSPLWPEKPFVFWYRFNP